MSAENGNIQAATMSATQPKQPKSAEAIKAQTQQLTNGLTRLTPARDLTLGGRGATKKTFLPNLNAVRNKNANVKTSKDVTSTRGRRGGGAGAAGRGARGGGGGKRGGGGNSSLIQTTGLFSEGAGAMDIRKSYGSSDYERNKEDTSIAQMRKPVINKNAQTKIDVKEEAAKLRSILGDSDDDDDKLGYGVDKTETAQYPIKLDEANWKYIKEEIKLEKLEPPSSQITSNTQDDSILMAQHLQTLHVQQQQQTQVREDTTQHKRLIYPQSVEAFLNTTEPQLFLMQIPDVMPCVGDDDDAEKDAKHEKKHHADSVAAGTSNSVVEDAAAAAATSKTQPRRNVFKEMEEGQIGKLVRYKSGKIKLVLGETHFDLDMGMETGFLQELMSISTNREERSGNMINLGPIQAKLNATPDWEYLFEEQQKNAARSTRQS